MTYMPSEIPAKYIVLIIVSLTGLIGGPEVIDRISPIETQQAVQTEQYKNILEKISDIEEDDKISGEKISTKLDALSGQIQTFHLNQVAMQKDIESNTRNTEAALETLQDRTVPISEIFKLREDVDRLQNQN